MAFTNKNMAFVDYLFAFTDDVGIFQNSKYGVPDRNFGYTTDDNARALILAVMLYEKFREKKFMTLIYKYLSFVLHAQNNHGKFKNFMNYQREFLEIEGSEDCFGRCLWAIGRTITSPSLPESIKNTCRYILKEAEKNIQRITSPRAKAYIIVGLGFLTASEKMAQHIEDLSMSLVEQYKMYKDGDWHWFEDSMTYGNAFFPWSLLVAYKIFKKECYLKTARESMDFLGSITMGQPFFKPIGCNGWLVKGSPPACYDEQPIEACEAIFSYIEYYEITKDKKYLDDAFKCFNWYKGANSKGLSLIDKETGACYDGLTENGLNLNQGSESIISYGMAAMKNFKYID